MQFTKIVCFFVKQSRSFLSQISDADDGTGFFLSSTFFLLYNDNQLFVFMSCIERKKNMFDLTYIFVLWNQSIKLIL